MRPVRLDLAGFTVFRDETTVDFAGADFFVLLGPTGSGKSTVLDAICFALYGTVPRWDDLRRVDNALSPSANEARVRLVFESAGRRYVASRVLRRSARGKVTTTRAGLERLPDGFDLSTLDSGGTAGELGEVLAGTPSEMTDAVTAAVGLPYEQFITCVVLPQGAFAEFLHAKPAKRQEILVNLLGLKVYDQIGERARLAAKEADGKRDALDGLLAGMPDATEQAVAEAEARVGQLRELRGTVDGMLPELTAAQERAATAREALDALDGEGRALAAVKAPAGTAELAADATAARAGAERATAAVADAERAEEELAGTLAEAGDPGRLRLLLDRHAERDRLAGQLTQLAERTEAAARELATARTAAERAEAAYAAAERALAAARTAEVAAALRPELAVGAPCPVCEQEVHQLPAHLDAPRVAEAQRAVAAARKQRDGTDRAARELDGAVTAARHQHRQLTERSDELATELAGAPEPAVLTERLAAADRLRQQLDAARRRVRTARQARDAAQQAAEQADERVRRAWRAFETARDSVGAFGPPATDRDDLATAWQQLAGWAAAAATERRAARVERLAIAKQAAAVADAVHGKLAALLAEHGLPAVTVGSRGEYGLPAGTAGARGESGQPAVAAGSRGERADAGRYTTALALAVQTAEHAQARATERHAQAGELRNRRADHERAARVARALANHLAANRFERWLLAEALDLLVSGASAILRELTGGQYELAHASGEFFVVDHHDAEQHRPVRTLSGGETFQASLALALALSEQLAGMSTSATSLESIMLDEGFGTLDSATLDTVAATLENLAARGDRMVGVVTHVAELAERIPVRFEVGKNARTAFVERVGA
jgi:exonuclease SbcC